ncbi:MAG: serine/threonine protein kinase [Planctomycetaceae bacterium]
MSEEAVAVATCPKNDVLAQLVSGSLVEERAESLFAHIDSCAQCQNIIDQLNARANGLLKVAQKQNQAAKTEVGKLDQLIQNAQQLKSPSSANFFLQTKRRSKGSSANGKRVSIDGFVNGLKRSGLFEENEVAQFLGDTKTDDSGELAKALIERGKLTPFQARSLLRGRWKGFVLGNYVILDKLGQGGMGSVFKARHRRMGRIVCLKVMNSSGRKSPELMHRFRQEARTIGALNHPNIVVAHDADEANGIPFLVMEYIKGNDLARHIGAHGPLSVEQALLVTTQAARALSYAHGAGVVHRDIKPHNLLLSDQASSDSEMGTSVKVLDMGLARFDSFLADNPDASVHAAMTNTGVIMGTVDYMAPEQAICTRDADNRSDIYSLGCTLHFLLTGQPVYEGETIMARLVAHRETAIPSLQTVRPDVTVELDAVFARMMAKKPEDRYQSMDDLVADLTLVTTGQKPVQAMAAFAQIGAQQSAAGANNLVSAPVESIVERTRSRAMKSKRTILGWLGGVGAACGLTAAMMQLDDGSGLPHPRTNSGVVRQIVVEQQRVVGHPGTRRNGGRGRAVFILPTELGTHFDDKQFVEIRKSLEQDGVEWSVMGSSNLPATPKEGHVSELQPDLSLTDFKPGDFDAIFLVEGTLRELTSKASSTHATVKTVFDRALKHGVVISVVGDGDACDVVDETGHLAGMHYDRREHISIGRRSDLSGSFVKIHEEASIEHATNVIFKQLLKPQRTSDSK